MQPIYLVCGVPGAGKSWVCEQLTDKFTYIPHDQYISFNSATSRLAHIKAVINAAQTNTKPIITECPFAEDEVRGALQQNGITVYPYFVTVDPDVAKQRYEQRDGKPYRASDYTRAARVGDRAVQWGVPYGDSGCILDTILKNCSGS